MDYWTKNNSDEEYFDLPEDPENLRIQIHKNFRMICTCNINNIKDMSPAFVNRFDVISLENQLEGLGDEDLGKLISNIFISFDRIPQNATDIEQNQNEDEVNIKKEIKEIKEEIEVKEKQFLKNKEIMIQKIVNKIKLLPDKIVEDKSKEYPHLKTISAISRFCYGIKKLKSYLENGKYQKFKISEDDIINTVFDMLFKEEEKT